MDGEAQGIEGGVELWSTSPERREPRRAGKGRRSQRPLELHVTGGDPHVFLPCPQALSVLYDVGNTG